jgi:hypothetical protein
MAGRDILANLSSKIASGNAALSSSMRVLKLIKELVESLLPSPE